MGQSYRIKTKLGVDQTLNVQLDQDFEFLEILSLKIRQEDIYNRNCADYGVLVGRITANGGLGIPNARVSIFIPIESVDESNPVITSIYPYKSPTDKNEDGFRYNLLPYEKSYQNHTPTGTFPSRKDALTDKVAVEIYDKYYRFSSKTNESGDYMILGVPLGSQTVVMDLDLSDIGEFSLTTQDLLRMGRGTESQLSGGNFRSSSDLNSLPQIVSLTKNLEVSPIWGDESLCQASINRLDFDLRDDANIEIQPTSIFMGSIFSSPDKQRVRDKSKPKDNLGNLCQLESNIGQIIALRQTIFQDDLGYPIIETHQLENGGNVIDSDGTWLIELPMNLDYIVTNEFGENVISNDPSIGIPTKSKYRFKVKWDQPNDLTLQTRRAYFLVPNVKEYGWENSFADPNYNASNSNKRKLSSSYYFGLDWSGYTDGFVGQQLEDRTNEIINCEDTFYEFKYNKVYTVSELIDEYKNGGRGRFVGIKEIDDDSCSGSINKFPVNDGFKNFDAIFFVFSILMQILQFGLLPLLIVAHIILGLYSIVIGALCLLCSVEILGIRPFGFICNLLNIKCQKGKFIIRLPMITYPNCQACSCKETSYTNEAVLGGTQGTLLYVSNPVTYYDGFQSLFAQDGTPSEDIQLKSLIYSQAIGGVNDSVADLDRFKTTKSNVVRFLSEESDERKYFAYSTSLPLGERINMFNTRKSYFSNLNKIKVTFDKDSNLGKYHFDNTLTLLSNDFYESGQLLTAVNPATTTDVNFRYTADTSNGIVNGITGTSYPINVINVSYATTETSEQTITYSLSKLSTLDRQYYPMDREYYQVLTAITISEAIKIWNTSELETFPNVLDAPSRVFLRKKRVGIFGYSEEEDDLISPLSVLDDIDNKYILILQRGVDPYSPKFVNEYKLGRLFGKSIDDPNFTLNISTRLNIPIRRLQNSNKSVQSFNQNEMFYPSYFFTPGADFSAFTTSTIGYYGRIDSTYSNPILNNKNMDGVDGKVTKTNNEFYSSSQNSAKYDLSEDISGSSYIYCKLNAELFFTYKDLKFEYLTPNYYPILQSSPMLIDFPIRNVVRTDRLPSSDGLNGSSWTTNPALLQQNNNFIFYNIPELDENILLESFGTGAQIPTADIEGLPNDITILETFECQNMVGLDCYKGFGDTFRVDDKCTTKDAVEDGCYLFLRRPLLDLFKDIGNFGEWAYRFRVFYGLCRGVLSQTFTNNWINGTLFAFPIQVNTFYDNENKPSIVEYSKELIYFDTKTNSFYYRSSPYDVADQKFVGKSSVELSNPVNNLNLLFPTTIMDLGYKNLVFGQISFNPETRGFVINNLSSTSFGDTSDLVNLFVISRITDEGFLQQMVSLGDSSINQFFSRTELRIDGDLAQLMSINSEVGVIKFSPEYYKITEGNPNNPVKILGTPNNPSIGVWFSSSTENLQTKDYITPGRINFRSQGNNFPYTYGIKSQKVPMYQWKLSTITPIFGNQNNDWATGPNDITSQYYQSLDRTSLTNPTYFQSASAPSNNDLYKKGYIFSADYLGKNSQIGANTNKFIVGAPFQFYFGIIKGASALDKFKTKYLADE
jgi:hypothetical protein